MKSKKPIAIISAAALILPLGACSASGNKGDYMPDAAMGDPGMFEELENYVHEDIVERGFIDAATQPDSYFSLDRNTASYSYMRRIINEGNTVAASSVRLEEYINYFNYDYARPTDGLALSGSVTDCPWNDEHKLMTIGVAAEEIQFGTKPNNIVFLIDTSGSMYGADRLGLIQQAFTMLTDTLSSDDTVSIVTYAGDSRVALDGESGAHKTKIANVIQDLEASGSTNGQGGINKAYALARKYFDAGANNRVILATDGDFNVGASSKSQLERLIKEQCESGIYLSVLGVGMYNTNDITMKTLAENGNGNYAYLDSVNEARKVLIEELDGTFNVVAKDAKIGVTFNADVVEKYRLIGYESKMLSQEEFEDEKTDAGEIGSGHTVTAVYEVELKSEDGDIATSEVRYKLPETEESKSVALTLTTAKGSEPTTEDGKFIGCVTEFGLVLRKSKYAANASLDAVIERLEALDCTGADGDPFKVEFLELVKKAKEIYAKKG